MKYLPKTFTTVCFITMVTSGQALSPAQILDPTMDCGISPQELRKCLVSKEKNLADKKTKDFCNDIVTYASNNKQLQAANQSMKNNSAFLNARSQKKRIVELSGKQKIILDKLMIGGLSPEQIGKIPALDTNQIDNFSCKKIKEGQVYKGKIIGEGIINHSKTCGLDLREVDSCIKKERGGAGQGDSLCNDIKLFAGNKQKIAEWEGTQRTKPSDIMSKMLVEVRATQAEYTDAFKKIGLDQQEIDNIPALSRSDDHNFQCADKVSNSQR
ncbi:MAG: hypothetical protein FJX03_06855 [Alphaproteobacteria bacterium]|nr:hypothetical protein [Alphaproteobacteria bacterium]